MGRSGFEVSFGRDGQFFFGCEFFGSPPRQYFQDGRILVGGNGSKPGGERARDAGAPRDPPVRSPRTISRARPRVRGHRTGRGMRRDDPTWRAQKTKKMTNTCFGGSRPHRNARSRCEDTTPPSSSPVPTIGGRLRRQRSFFDSKPGEKVDKTSRFPDPEFSRLAREGSPARVVRRVDV